MLLNESDTLLILTVNLMIWFSVQMDSVRQLAEQLEWFHVAGILMFLWATYHHHVAHKIFAGLRTGHKGTVLRYFNTNSSVML